ncbi:MAG: CBS domain-containing protein [Gemmataceae bacterium]
MIATTCLSSLTAADVMSQDPVCLPSDMPLRNAVHLLIQNQVSGAPVVNAAGRCVGVFSAGDVLRLAERRADVTKPVAPPLPLSCAFQRRENGRLGGKEKVRCALPLGVCPLQRLLKLADKQEVICSQPNCVLLDWQMVELEKLPTDEVRKFMTADVVLVARTTPAPLMARMMIDAHIHRLVVADEDRRPIGIVSSTDLLALLARMEEDVENNATPEVLAVGSGA